MRPRTHVRLAIIANERCTIMSGNIEGFSSTDTHSHKQLNNAERTGACTNIERTMCKCVWNSSRKFYQRTIFVANIAACAGITMASFMAQLSNARDKRNERFKIIIMRIARKEILWNCEEPNRTQSHFHSARHAQSTMGKLPKMHYTTKCKRIQLRMHATAREHCVEQTIIIEVMCMEQRGAKRHTSTTHSCYPCSWTTQTHIHHSRASAFCRSFRIASESFVAFLPLRDWRINHSHFSTPVNVA